MGRKPRLYVPLTVTFFEDDRIIQSGDGPTLLYVAMLLRCKVLGTDGRLTETQIDRLGRRRWRQELVKLAALSLVVRDEFTGEWCVAAWFAHNDSLEEVDARRAADRDRKAAEAAARKAADSERNPNGNVLDSALKERKGKEQEGKERKGNPRGVHRFEADGDGGCVACLLPATNAVHLRSIDGGLTA
jgi:hypothetical protein